MMQGTQSQCSGTIWRDGVGRRGLGFRMEGTHVCPWPFHVDVWQKPSQYCKAIIRQLKQIKKKKKSDLASGFRLPPSTVVSHLQPRSCFILRCDSLFKDTIKPSLLNLKSSNKYLMFQLLFNMTQNEVVSTILLQGLLHSSYVVTRLDREGQ